MSSRSEPARLLRPSLSLLRPSLTPPQEEQVTVELLYVIQSASVTQDPVSVTQETR